MIWLLIIWTIVWKSIAAWYAAKNRQVFWYVFAWLSPTFGVIEMCYVYYMRYHFVPKRCRECFNLPVIVVYKVGPLSQVETIAGKEAIEFCEDNNITP